MVDAVQPPCVLAAAAAAVPAALEPFPEREAEPGQLEQVDGEPAASAFVAPLALALALLLLVPRQAVREVVEPQDELAQRRLGRKMTNAQK